MVFTRKTPLWGLDQNGQEVHIPVLGVTGKWKSGKSLFLGSIAPGAFDDGKSRTKYYDFELSATSYQGLGMEYVDVPGRMRELNGVDEYKPIDVFRWWRNELLAIPAGAYDVLAVDPITDIESGMVEYVLSLYQQYGFKDKDKFKAMGGVFWGAVNDHWKRFLADIASRCRTFAFSTHMRKVWVGDKPTNQDTPKGKTTLTELANLYLWLERGPDEKGVEHPTPRCRQLLKDRVCFTAIDPQTYQPIIVPYLPPAFDNCTPNRIRQYIAAPANYAALKENERVSPILLTEAERQQNELAIAEARQKAEEAALERTRRQQELLALQQSPAAVQAAAAVADNIVRASKSILDAAAEVRSEKKDPASPAPSAVSDDEVPFDIPAEPPVVVEGGMPRPGYCRPEQAALLVQLKQRLNLPLERWEAGIAKRTGGSTNVLDLTEAQAAEVIKLFRDAAEKAGV